MFSTRTNQENTVYHQQRVAAAKPLNQHINGLAPKTPGIKDPKTPFKIPLKDENAILKTGKAGKSKIESLVTPAGPRDRAPLGNKTTNAKAIAFQTPSLGSKTKAPANKPTSPRLKKSRIQVHQAEPEATSQDDQDSEPDIEYVPPREAPLPDHPDDWPHDRAYPQFEGKNFTRGWYSAFRPEPDSDEDSLGDMEEFRREMQRLRLKEQRERQSLAQSKQVDHLTSSKPTTIPAAAPSTLKSRDAATVLSASSSHTRQPSWAAPTASTKARSVISKPGEYRPSGSALPGNPRHTAAKVASNSTLGYTKGRVVSRTKKAREDDNLEPEKSVVPKAPSAPPPALERIFGPSFGLEEYADKGDDWDSATLTEFEEELEDFQLEAP